MWKCSKCGETVEESFDLCWNCGTAADGTEDPSFASQKEPIATAADELPEGVVLSTTPTLESHRVTRYLGIVCGEAIVGANVFLDIFAGITDVVGGRSQAYESALGDARRLALAEMAHRAKDLGGNAVLSIDMKYESIRGSMLMVCCCGTAVEVVGLEAEK